MHLPFSLARIKITNGVLLVAIGLLHTRLAISSDGFGRQFSVFAASNYFSISDGLTQLPAEPGRTDFASFAAFWFFYFGILLIPIGLLVHSIEKERRALPCLFTLSYLIVVLVGCYMVPYSGMTFFMLPQAIYMLVKNRIRARSSASAVV
jgi:hypothetical protein